VAPAGPADSRAVALGTLWATAAGIGSWAAAQRLSDQDLRRRGAPIGLRRLLAARAPAPALASADGASVAKRQWDAERQGYEERLRAADQALGRARDVERARREQTRRNLGRLQVPDARHGRRHRGHFVHAIDATAALTPAGSGRPGWC
jgi:hypothetical protein